MEKRHIINLQGREFVTYEGLLDEAHQRGLRSIRTQLVQIPSDANGNVAICTAEVELMADGEPRVFTGIGDASPRNTSRNVAAHVIRMAETRAKARAMRDAINVGMTALEELESAELAPEEGSPRSPSSPSAASGRTLTLVTQEAAGTPEQPAASQLASRAQIEKVSREMQRTGFSQEQGRAYLSQQFNKTSRLELTSSEIEQFLRHLKKLPAAEAAGS